SRNPRKVWEPAGQRSSAGRRPRGVRAEAGIGSLAGVRTSRQRRCRDAVDEGLDRGRRPKAGGEVEEFRAHAKKTLLHLLIECDVSASEAVDRLLRIADEKESCRGRGGQRANLCNLDRRR